MNPLTILGLKALAVLAAIGTLLWGIHTLDQSRQQIGYDRRVAEDNAALIRATAAARERERTLNQQLETAKNDATKRDQDIRSHAAAAATASDRLRIALDTIRRGVPGDPAQAGPQRTSTLAELLGDCADRYRGVAEKADRHASDARTLSEGWPK
ncbi:MAG: DUF2514 family protein [Sterolibacterium sp.]|jgi:hypothetical protein